MAILLIQIGLGILGLLGVMHGLYTLKDFRKPFYFAPRDRELVTVLETAGMGITDQQNNFWRAYLGFHLSHSLGILVFVVTFFGLTFINPALIFHPFLSAILIGTGVLYAILSRVFWFSKPFIGVSLATLLFVAGLAVHMIGGT